MDKTVENFFTKNADKGYIDQYDLDHGPRLDAMIEKWNLKQYYRNQSVVDVGGGLGFLGKRLDETTRYSVIDGAFIPIEKRLCQGTYIKANLDKDNFGEWHEDIHYYPKHDAAFCLETLEHLTNPYNCLVGIKKIVKENHYIYISIPHFNVTHNYIYPGLMADPQVFAQFLGQMALVVEDYFLWDRGWNAHHFKVRNAAWIEAKMLFPKSEPHFQGQTPLGYVNM